MSPPPSLNGNVLPDPPDPRAAVAVAVANRRRRAEVRLALRRREIGWRGLLVLAAEEPVIGRLFVADCVRLMRGKATPPTIQIQLHKLKYHPKLRIAEMGVNQRALVQSWWP